MALGHESYMSVHARVCVHSKTNISVLGIPQSSCVACTDMYSPVVLTEGNERWLLAPHPTPVRLCYYMILLMLLSLTKIQEGYLSSTYRMCSEMKSGDAQRNVPKNTIQITLIGGSESEYLVYGVYVSVSVCMGGTVGRGLVCV